MANDLQARAEKQMVKVARDVFTFKVPPKMAARSGIQTIGLYELTTKEETQAAKRCGTDMSRMAYELTLAALASVNGKPVSMADGTAEEAWGKMGPKVRTLAMTA